MHDADTGASSEEIKAVSSLGNKTWSSLEQACRVAWLGQDDASITIRVGLGQYNY